MYFFNATIRLVYPIIGIVIGLFKTISETILSFKICLTLDLQESVRTKSYLNEPFKTDLKYFFITLKQIIQGGRSQ